MFIFKKHTTQTTYLVYSVCTMHSMQMFLYTTLCTLCFVYLNKIQYTVQMM